jgi:hypothetical protein
LWGGGGGIFLSDKHEEQTGNSFNLLISS